MSRIKIAVQDYIELYTNDTDENGNYPGEEDSKAWEISKYSNEELINEVIRRMGAPF